MTEYPDNKPGQELLLRVQNRVREQESGVYDINAMYEENLTSSPTLSRLRLKTRSSEAPNCLLLRRSGPGSFSSVNCRSAIESTPPYAYVYVFANLHEFKAFLGAEGGIGTLALQKVFRNPLGGANLATSYCGSYKPAYVSGLGDEQPVVDL